MTSGAADRGTDTTTNDGASAASSSAAVRKVRIPHSSSSARPVSALRVTSPVTAKRSGTARAMRRKKALRQPLPTIPKRICGAGGAGWGMAASVRAGSRATRAGRIRAGVSGARLGSRSRLGNTREGREAVPGADAPA